MINKVLTFLAAELNGYLKKRFLFAEDHVMVSPLANADGSLLPETSNKIVITLVNISQDVPVPVQSVADMTLDLLISASFDNYQESLEFISYTLAFFQQKNIFNPDNSVQLDAGIEQLLLQPQPLSLQELSLLYRSLGIKYRPSMIYRISVLTVQPS